MTCAQGLLRLLWGGARSWSATGLPIDIEQAGATPGTPRCHTSPLAPVVITHKKGQAIA